MSQAVCFIGHRTIQVTDALIKELTQLLQYYIAHGTTVFNFGSHSAFDRLCYNIICELKKQHPQIQRVHYCIPYENYTTAGVNHDYYEREIDSRPAFQAHQKSYIARNCEMIDHSDVCIFYYDASYQPPRRKRRRRDLTDYQPQSGTALAYAYARQKRKCIICFPANFAKSIDKSYDGNKLKEK